MISIGLDVGTGFVKCVSDHTMARFPSLYAYRHPSAWEDKKGIIEAVGYDAASLARHPDAVLIRPIMLGRPVNGRAFEALAMRAVEEVTPKKDAVGGTNYTDISVTVGLPFDAKDQRREVKKTLSRLFSIESCHVVLQVAGTLVEAGLSDAGSIWNRAHISHHRLPILPFPVRRLICKMSKFREVVTGLSCHGFITATAQTR